VAQRAAPPTRPSATPGRGPETVSPSSSAAHRPSTECKDLRRAHERAFAEGDYTDCAPDQRPSRALIERTFECFETPQGVVAHFVEQVRPWPPNTRPCSSFDVHAVIRHPRAGDEEQGTARLASDMSPQEVRWRLDRLVGAFDFDGDGSPERLVEAHRYDELIHGIPLLAVLTADRSAYPGAKRYSGETLRDERLDRRDTPRVDRAEDVDGDGRPDLILRTPFTAEWGYVADLDPLLLVHVPLLAHSLPDGTFSESDAVARAFAQRSCPEPPTQLAPASHTQAARVETGRRIACARLWGRTPASVLAALRPHCATYDEPSGDQGRERNLFARALAPGECPHWWRQWAEARAPFALP